MSGQIHWETIARELQFKDVQHMWQVLYGKYTVYQLSLRFGVSTNVIIAQLKKHDVKRRSRGGPNNLKFEIDEPFLLELKQRGVTAIAKEKGIDVTTIYKALRRAGLDSKGAPLSQKPESEPSSPAESDPGDEPDPSSNL